MADSFDLIRRLELQEEGCPPPVRDLLEVLAPQLLASLHLLERLARLRSSFRIRPVLQLRLVARAYDIVDDVEHALLEVPVVEVALLEFRIPCAAVLLGEVCNLLLRCCPSSQRFVEPLLLLLGFGPEDLGVPVVGIEDDVVGVRDRLGLR